MSDVGGGEEERDVPMKPVTLSVTTREARMMALSLSSYFIFISKNPGGNGECQLWSCHSPRPFSQRTAHQGHPPARASAPTRVNLWLAGPLTIEDHVVIPEFLPLLRPLGVLMEYHPHRLSAIEERAGSGEEDGTTLSSAIIFQMGDTLQGLFCDGTPPLECPFP